MWFLEMGIADFSGYVILGYVFNRFSGCANFAKKAVDKFYDMDQKLMQKRAQARLSDKHMLR